MKVNHFVNLATNKKLPEFFSDKYGDRPEQFITAYYELIEVYREDIKKIPWGALGLYNYWHSRIKTGLKQLIAGVRKMRLDEINRNDLASLTERAKKVSGIPMVNEVDEETFEEILLG